MGRKVRRRARLTASPVSTPMDPIAVSERQPDRQDTPVAAAR